MHLNIVLYRLMFAVPIVSLSNNRVINSHVSIVLSRVLAYTVQRVKRR